MATRRRVGFSTSTSEASRRQLMVPVPCWEKVWGPPDGALPGTTLRVYKWVKTDKQQQFSDDEGEADEPLAPIQPEDLVEVVDGDDDEQDEQGGSALATPAPVSREVSEPAPGTATTPGTPTPGPEGADPLKPPSPAHKPHPLSISFQPPSPTPVPEDDADDGLGEMRPPQEQDGEGEDGGLGDQDMGDMTLDLGGVGPDGEAFEGVNDLSQLQQTDGLLGGGMLDTNMEDPFAIPPS